MSQPERPIAIAIVGVGKIARDQHLPALRANPRFELVAGVDPVAGVDGLPRFASVAELLQRGPRVDAVALCTPPQARAAIAHQALEAGWHVLLEKPPAATMVELGSMQEQAARRSLTLFAAWHARFAPQVAAARDWLAARAVRAGRIAWREDVRKWHPGQHWLWQPGGPGVFDPGINALSILTLICHEPVAVTGAQFEVPVNCHAPIAARLSMTVGAAPVEVEFDFRQTTGETWDIALHATDGGRLLLSRGGSLLTIDSAPVQEARKDAYPLIYQRFADLIRSGRSDCDGTPLQLVEDAMRMARRSTVDAFEP